MVAMANPIWRLGTNTPFDVQTFGYNEQENKKNICKKRLWEPLLNADYVLGVRIFIGPPTIFCAKRFLHIIGALSMHMINLQCIYIFAVL